MFHEYQLLRNSVTWRGGGGGEEEAIPSSFICLFQSVFSDIRLIIGCRISKITDNF